MGIKYKQTDSSYRVIGVFSSASAFLTDRNVSSAVEGDTYYDTTLNQLRTYDGTNWSAAGLSPSFSGTLNNVAASGQKITIDGSTISSTIEIETSNNGLASGACLLLDNDDSTNNPVVFSITNAGSGNSIDITGTSGNDIDGTSSSWYVQYDGDALFNTVSLLDDTKLHLGNAIANGDVNMLFHDGAVGTAGNGLLIAASAANEQIQIGDASYAFDVWWVGETATTNYIKLDVDGGADSVGALVCDNTDIDLGDNDKIRLGDSADVTVCWDNTNLQVTGAANNSDIVFGADGTGFSAQLFGDTAGSNLNWISDYDRLVFASTAASYDTGLQLDDWVGLTFGTGANFGSTGDGDVQMYWDSTKLLIIPTAANTTIQIGDSTYYTDFLWYGNGATNYILFDGDVPGLEISEVDIWTDSGINLTNLTCGVSNAGILKFESSDYLGLYSASYPVYIYGTSVHLTNTYGGTAGLIYVDGDLTVSGAFSHTGAYAPSSVLVGDNKFLKLGTDSDFTFKWDGSTLLWEALAADTELDIGKTTNFDVKIHGGTNTNYVLFDTDDSALLADYRGFGIRLSDGTDTFTIGPVASNALPIEAGTANRAINIGATTNIDVKICGATATNYFLYDTDDSSLQLECRSTGINFEDAASSFKFGPVATNAMPIDASAANETINIGATTNTDVVFHGGNAGRDLHWDASANTAGLLDNALLGFGNTAAAPDISIKWDATDLLIEGAAANTAIKIGATNNQDLYIYAATATNYIQFNTDDTANQMFIRGMKQVFSDGTSTFTIGPPATNALPIDAGTTNETINIGASTNTDVVFHGGDAGRDVHWDASADTLRTLDSAIVGFGTGGTADYDIGLSYTGGTNILNIGQKAAGTGEITIGADGKGIDVTFFTETATGSMLWDQDGATNVGALTFNGAAILFNDTNVDYTLVEASDGLSLTATNHASAKLTLGSAVANGLDVDILSGTADDKIAWDAGAKTLSVIDCSIVIDPTTGAGNVNYTIGSSTDSMTLTATDHANAKLILGASGTNALDITIQGATAAEQWLYDGGANSLSVTNGTVAYTLDHSTHSLLLSATDHASAKVVIGAAGTNGVDLALQGATAAENWTYDSGANSLTVTDGTCAYALDHSANNLALTATDNANSKLVLGASGGTHGLDTILQSITAGAEITFDAAAKTFTVDGINTVINDDDILKFGDGGEVTMRYDEDGNDELQIQGRVWNDTTWCKMNVEPVCIGKAGAAASGTTGAVNLMHVNGTTFEYCVLGAGETILGPSLSTNGIDISMDDADDEGIELTQGISALSKHCYTIGTSPAFHLKVRYRIHDVSGTDDCAIGFRKVQAYQTGLDTYTDLACLNVISGAIKIETILNDGATTTTDTTDTWVDDATKTLEVYVSAAGVVTYKIEGAAPTQTAAFTFDATDTVIPFMFFLHAAPDFADATEIISWECGPDTV